MSHEHRPSQWPCPHCERGTCRTCTDRPVATQPTRDEAVYWQRGRHFPDHTGQGLYRNGPEDFGNQLWSLSLDRWMDDAEQTVESAERLRVWQEFDSNRRMVEHLAITPETVGVLKLGLLRGAFTPAQVKRVRSLILQAAAVRSKLLAENSVLAAVLRAKMKARSP